MKGILHKLNFLHKKLSLTVILVMLGWFVCAAGNFDNFEPQVKIVKFYPNPATSYINFEFPNDINRTYMLQIFSFVGNKMAEMPVTSNKITFVLSADFYRGIYLFRLSDRSGKVIETGKFQVIR